MSDNLVRLTVNMNQETADALREIAKGRGISLTEAVRRCVGVYAYLDDEINAGRAIRTQGKNGENAREVLFL